MDKKPSSAPLRSGDRSLAGRGTSPPPCLRSCVQVKECGIGNDKPLESRVQSKSDKKKEVQRAGLRHGGRRFGWYGGGELKLMLRNKVYCFGVGRREVVVGAALGSRSGPFWVQVRGQQTLSQDTCTLHTSCGGSPRDSCPDERPWAALRVGLCCSKRWWRISRLSKASGTR